MSACRRCQACNYLILVSRFNLTSAILIFNYPATKRRYTTTRPAYYGYQRNFSLTCRILYHQRRSRANRTKLHLAQFYKQAWVAVRRTCLHLAEATLKLLTCTAYVDWYTHHQRTSFQTQHLHGSQALSLRMVRSHHGPT